MIAWVGRVGGQAAGSRLVTSGWMGEAKIGRARERAATVAMMDFIV